ncbi:MAG: hypothetical protein M1821_001814 [Bathelium mastoideum]|nr:MAG: hypothetical protein M1821_001814 [Bathelium mastoideum]KAI9691713.1 MAG: hypothetical protein M1822_007785 [Bathelium mastoideum]
MADLPPDKFDQYLRSDEPSAPLAGFMRHDVATGKADDTDSESDIDELWEPQSMARSDPNPLHFDVLGTAPKVMQDIQGQMEYFSWICASSETQPNDAPLAIRSKFDAGRNGCPFWAQSMDLAIHVLAVLLDAASKGSFRLLINIANYAKKFVIPLEELQRIYVSLHREDTWTRDKQTSMTVVTAFKIMMEVSEFMCITARYLQFGENVLDYADALFAKTAIHSTQQRLNWAPGHELKKLQTQIEWARANGFDEWFPSTLRQLRSVTWNYETYGQECS